jgi:hypothetical protein
VQALRYEVQALRYEVQALRYEVQALRYEVQALRPGTEVVEYTLTCSHLPAQPPTSFDRVVLAYIQE